MRTPANPPESTPPLQSCLSQWLDKQTRHLSADYRQYLQDELQKIVSYQATIGVMGKSGTGKSSLCNALFGQEETAVSDVTGGTRYPQEITLAYQSGRGISLIDMPGVGESLQNHEEYREQYQALLPELDLILWLIKADDRALSLDQQCYQELLQPNLAKHSIPVLFVISQADKIEPCREWDGQQHHPGPLQQENLALKQRGIAESFNIPNSHICVIAAAENYGLPELVENIVRALPHERKWGVVRETKPEQISNSTWQLCLACLWQLLRSRLGDLARKGKGVMADKLSTLWGR